MKNSIDINHIGRLFWIIAGSILIFWFLVWSYGNQKNPASGGIQSAVQESYPEGGEVPVPLTRDGGPETYASSVQGSCPLERCLGASAGTILTVDGLNISYSEEVSDGELIDGGDVKNFTLRNLAQVKYFDISSLEYYDGDGFAVGDQVHVVSAAGQQYITIITYNN